MKKALFLVLVSLISSSIFAQYVRDTGPLTKTKTPSSAVDHFRLEMNYGLGRRFGKVDETGDPTIDAYLNKLKTGSNINLTGTYFWSANRGLGFMFDNFKTSNSLSPVLFTTDTDTLIGTLADNISISHFSVTYNLRKNNLANTNSLILSFGLGYTEYRNDATFYQKFMFTGSTVGINLAVGYDLRIMEHLWLGAKGQLITGMLNEIIINGVKYTAPHGEGESLFRGSLSGGLRYAF